MNLTLMSESRCESIINAPVETIDLTEWVFTLSDKDYQECSKDHIAAASTYSPDGKRMSINVERVGRLLVQHYVEDIAERRHCRLVSISDTFGPTVQDRGQVHVTWEFFVEPLDANKATFVNHVEVRFMPGYEEALRRDGITLEQAQAASLERLRAHNAEETPLFAKNVERKALAGHWSR